MSEIKWFKKSDVILIIILLVLAVLAYAAYAFIYRNDGQVTGQVYYNNQPVMTVDLSEPRVFWLEQHPNVRFEVKNGAIAFIESDCPDKVCVNSGYLHLPGQMAACLPNRMSIQIVSVNGYNETDVIAR